MTIALAVFAVAAVAFFLRVLAALIMEASAAPVSAVAHPAKYMPGKRPRRVLIEMNSEKIDIEALNIEAHREDIPLRTRERIAR